jgi:hypothetical protein
MCEASRLARPPVDGDSDVHNVANAAEEIVQVLVRHLEGHVADEKGLGGLVDSIVAATAAAAARRVCLLAVVLDNKVAAFEDLHIEVVDSGTGVVDGLELYVTESREYMSVRISLEDVARRARMTLITYPLLRLRLSRTILMLSMAPKREKMRFNWSSLTS